jgi:hypothetical protein
VSKDGLDLIAKISRPWPCDDATDRASYASKIAIRQLVHLLQSRWRMSELTSMKKHGWGEYNVYQTKISRIRSGNHDQRRDRRASVGN